MSSEQESASGAGECAGACASRKRLARTGASNVGGTTSCNTGAIITTGGCAAVAVAVGFTGFSWGRTHDFIFAQQSAEQSIARTGMAMLHVCADAAKGAVKTARNTNAAMVPCFVTILLIAEKRPKVERRAVRRPAQAFTSYATRLAPRGCRFARDGIRSAVLVMR
jgi:hypothetical protein